MKRLLALSDSINRGLGHVSMAAGWLFFVCTMVIIFDVLSRKFGFQIPALGSTRLQELEWHLHTALFCFWLGFAYIKNAHVRIDVALTRVSSRGRAMVELLGCIFFALPYCLLALYFSWDFTWISFVDGETSASSNGLPMRWIPKGFITLGLLLLLVAVLSMTMRMIVHLRGPEALRSASAFQN